MRGPIPLISARDYPTGTVFSALMSALQMREIRLVARLGRDLRFANLETAFDWLTSAGIAIEATRVGQIDHPLGLSEDRTAFKFFLNDVGLLTSRLMGKAELDVINGKTSINYGSIFEAVVAQELLVRGYAPHYYSSKKHGEVDFVIEDSMTGETRLIEVKSGKDYHRHSALTGLLKSGAAKSAVVLHDGNLEVEGEVMRLWGDAGSSRCPVSPRWGDAKSEGLMSGKPFSLRTGAFNRIVSIRCAFKGGVQPVLDCLLSQSSLCKGRWLGRICARAPIASLLGQRIAIAEPGKR